MRIRYGGGAAHRTRKLGKEEAENCGSREEAGSGQVGREAASCGSGREAKSLGTGGKAGRCADGRQARRAAAGLILLAAAGALQLAARKLPGFGEWYATGIYPWIVGIYGRIFGIFPFSVVEILLYISIIWLILYTASHIWKPIAGKETARAAAGAWFSAACFILGLLAFLYTACCGVNYYRRPFSSYLELEVRDSSVEELRDLCEYLTEMVNETVDNAPYNAGWNAAGQQAMSRLADTYPQLSGFYPRPKGLLFRGSCRCSSCQEYIPRLRWRPIITAP